MQNSLEVVWPHVPCVHVFADPGASAARTSDRKQTCRFVAWNRCVVGERLQFRLVSVAPIPVAVFSQVPRTMALRQILKRLPASSAAWQQSACVWGSASTARHFAAPAQSEEPLKKTELYDFHVQQGGTVQASPVTMSDDLTVCLCLRTCSCRCHYPLHRSCAHVCAVLPSRTIYTCRKQV